MIRFRAIMGELRTTAQTYWDSSKIPPYSLPVFLPMLPIQENGRGRPIPRLSKKIMLRKEICNTKKAPVIMKYASSNPSIRNSNPWGVSCDSDGIIYVSDRLNHRICVFQTGGEPSHSFGSKGGLWGQFNQPIGITVDCKRRIIVVDKNNHRVQVNIR